MLERIIDERGTYNVMAMLAGELIWYVHYLISCHWACLEPDLPSMYRVYRDKSTSSATG